MARWLFLIAVAGLGLASGPAGAQNPGAIFEFFQQKLESEIQRQRQRDLERRSREQQSVDSDALNQVLQAISAACHDKDDLDACDLALAQRSLSAADRRRLLAKRQALVQAQQEAARAAAAEEAERAREEARERRRAAAEEARLAREAEDRRRAEARAYAAAVEGCRSFAASSCDQALASPALIAADRADLMARRIAAERFAADRAACRDGSSAACDAALASPAATDGDRVQLGVWRAEASPYQRAVSVVTTYGAAALTAAQNLPTTIAELPASTQILAVVATLLAMVLVVVAVRSRRSVSVVPEAAAAAPTEPAPAVSNPPVEPVAERATEPALEAQGTAPPIAPAVEPAIDVAAEPPRPTASEPAAAPAPPPPALVPVAARDTPAALAAMELALAYIEEVREEHRSNPDEEQRKSHLNALALATRKLDAARRADPDAMLEGQDDDGSPIRVTLSQIEAEVLLLEGLTHQVFDTRRAVPALTKACELNPHDPRAFYALGIIHAANMNRAAAVEALQTAVALDPRNITYRKELDRAESLTAGEIAVYKATRAGERIYDAGIATANVGIRAWNIFAFVWNTVTFPLRAMLWVLRLLRLAP